MPKLSKTVLGQRREHILHAAEVCFARDGFHRTTIADICRQAGVSTGAVYVYFPNKEAVVRALLQHAQKTRLAMLDAAGTTAEEKTQALLGWVTDVFSAQGKHIAHIDLNLWAEAVRNPRVAKIAKEALQEATRSISELVVRRQAQSSLRDLDADAISAVMVSLFLGLEVQAGIGAQLDLKQILRVLVALFQPATTDRVTAAKRAAPATQAKRTRRKS